MDGYLSLLVLAVQSVLDSQRWNVRGIHVPMRRGVVMGALIERCVMIYCAVVRGALIRLDCTGDGESRLRSAITLCL